MDAFTKLNSNLRTATIVERDSGDTEQLKMKEWREKTKFGLVSYLTFYLVSLFISIAVMSPSSSSLLSSFTVLLHSCQVSFSSCTQHAFSLFMTNDRIHFQWVLTHCGCQIKSGSVILDRSICQMHKYNRSSLTTICTILQDLVCEMEINIHF